jgi:hypothetical protein
MSWADRHRKSEELASRAHIAMLGGNTKHAEQLFADAAAFEQEAIDELDPSKQRTLGITVVSTASLWFKSKRYEEAQKVAYRWLSSSKIPQFAMDHLRSIVQACWTEEAKIKSGVQFVNGQIFFSIKGGQVVSGGAPLNLIVEKVQIVQSIFYRTAEYVKGFPHRAHGVPSQEITNSCRPWLFQEMPGSYQFSVIIQEPQQRSFFDDAHIKPELIAEKFFEIVKTGAEDPEDALSEIVSDIEYKKTFLKLTRNLAPSGRTFSQLEIRKSNDSTPVVLRPCNRHIISKFLNDKKDALSLRHGEGEYNPKYINGILRGLHLDQDWIEIISDDSSIKIRGLSDTVDDVIGPMLNRPVSVRVLEHSSGGYKFLDIELDE